MGTPKLSEITKFDVKLWLMDGFGMFYNKKHTDWVNSLTKEDLEDIDCRIIDATMNVIIEYAAEQGIFQNSMDELLYKEK